MTARRPALVGAVVLAVVAAAQLGAVAQAYELTGHRFSTGTVTYHDASGNRAAVRRAAKAWNSSGARIRFVAAPRSRARVIVRNLSRPVCAGLASFSTRGGVAARATIYLPRRDAATVACTDRFSVALIAAHELGHVIGLGHERRRCATMNPVGTRTGGLRCRSRARDAAPWLWRCRLLETDDVRGAVAIYGGRVRPRGRALCPVYAAGDAPRDLAPTLDQQGRLEAAFVRPSDALVPSFLTATFRGFDARGYGVRYARDTCPDVERGAVTSWDVAPGGVQQATVAFGLAPGRYCVVAWTVDRVARPSRRATAWIDVLDPAAPQAGL